LKNLARRDPEKEKIVFERQSPPGARFDIIPPEDGTPLEENKSP
jgi:hypothetical protein